MSPSIGCVVEGHGEVQALPLLLRRIAGAMDPPTSVDVRPPARLHRSKITRPGELERFARLVGVHAHGVLVLVDADDDCAARLAASLQTRLTAALPARPTAAVLAVREYESWFLAAATSLAGFRGLRQDLLPPADAEAVRGAKEWITAHMDGSTAYGAVADQAALSARIDLDITAAGSRSFRKLRKEVERLIDEQR